MVQETLETRAWDVWISTYCISRDAARPHGDARAAFCAGYEAGFAAAAVTSERPGGAPRKELTDDGRRRA
jgi:hypothetical protein